MCRSNSEAHSRCAVIATAHLFFTKLAPVGTSQTPFTGSIDGKNHVISGANVRAAHNAGLFGVLSGAKIKNLTLANSSVTTHVMTVAGFVSRVTNGKITNMLAEMNVNTGPNIDQYTIAGTVDEETLKYCLNFCSYQRAAKGRYKSCKVLTNASEYLNIYFPSSEYANANDTLDKSLWKDNKFWKKGAIHPELVTYEEYLEIKNGAQA